MKKRTLTFREDSPSEPNIYADKSALVLDWLLRIGVKKSSFSIRTVAKELSLSIGLVQKVFAVLHHHGLLSSQGVRTSKTFSLKRPNHLLQNWEMAYQIGRKCKMRTYRSGLNGKAAIVKAIHEANLQDKVAFALHSATESYDCKNTNLRGIEFYLLDSSSRNKVEKTLHMEPSERGYDILLIEPYYKQLLKQESKRDHGIKVAPPLLTFLDLYHFPLRGREQADYLLPRIPELNHLSKTEKLHAKDRRFDSH